MTEELKIGRILVALDASLHSRSAVEAASDLAARFHAEVLGLFVEDENLLRLAGLPCAEELAFGSRDSRSLDTHKLERALRLQREEVRRFLALTAQRKSVRWSFRVARGRVADELIRASAEVDMVVLGRAGCSPGPRGPLGSTARKVAATVTRTVVIAERGARLEHRAIVLFDGSQAALRALATAARIVEDGDAHLVVLIPSDEEENRRALQARVREWLETSGISARIYSTCLARGASALSQALLLLGGGTLLLPSGHPVVREAAFAEVIRLVKWPVILVR
jgi:nucleotide-binding universal stress UspA family protein